MKKRRYFNSPAISQREEITSASRLRPLRYRNFKEHALMMSGISHSPLLRAIAAHAADCPDKTALIDCDGNIVSYSALRDNIKRAASLLYSKGIGHGDRIILSAQKEPEFVYFYLASHMLGIVNVVTDAKNNDAHVDYIASVTTPALAIGCSPKGVESAGYADINLNDMPIDGFTIPDGLRGSDTADVMFTSGTTGNPKGVRLSHDNIAGSASNINGFVGNGADDVELLGLPICHSFGLGRLRCNMLTGATVVLHNGFANLKSVFSAIERYGVTGFGMVPAIWAYIKRFSGERIAAYASQIRYIEIGSAAMPEDDKRLLMRLFPSTRICMHYGLTEASRAVFMEFHEYAGSLDSIGRPVSDAVSVRILDSNGNPLPPGSEGELCISGNMVTDSYYDPADNTGAFVNGYFRTGDWGYEDSDGRLHLVARKKELINVGGKKVSPVEIEEALAAAGVGESMCVAVSDPDGILGEVPKALLVKGTFSAEPESIAEALRHMLEPYKLPRFYEVVDSIPKTASGKKKRTLERIP